MSLYLYGSQLESSLMNEWHRDLTQNMPANTYTYVLSDICTYQFNQNATPAIRFTIRPGSNYITYICIQAFTIASRVQDGNYYQVDGIADELFLGCDPNGSFDVRDAFEKRRTIVLYRSILNPAESACIMVSQPRYSDYPVDAFLIMVVGLVAFAVLCGRRRH